MTAPGFAFPARPATPPTLLQSCGQVTLRALRKYFRTPGLWAMGIAQSVMFLFMFRYVFGGYAQGGGSRYADFFIPAYVATIVLFTGGGISVAVAEDRASGFTGRLLSLPVPRFSIAAGRAAADFLTNIWSILITAGFGFAFGFRLGGTVADGLAALGLCLAYGAVFTVVFMVLGLIAPSAQAAQGMSLFVFAFAFISSTYVPAGSMPGWLQPFAKYQPVTPMVTAVRSLIAGSASDVGLALAWCALLTVVCTPLAVLRYRRG
jgi:ABC-2 type transport system permease protein